MEDIMLKTVTTDYVFDNPAPIELSVGDTVTLGERTAPDSEFPNWIYCESHKTGKKGWVAEEYLTIDGDIGTSKCDYTAKEMTVSVGDVVRVVYELNGWYWCERERDGESGWVDKGMVG
jgi:plastocyanin